MIKTTLRPIFAIFLLFVVANSCSTKDEVVSYDLATSVQPEEGGKITPMEGNFPSDTDVKIIATANDGYLFKTWAGASVDSSNNITLRMDSDKQLTAIFEKLDSDGDGVSDDVDECSDTIEGETVDENGCSDSQKDTDGDGITDALDQCDHTFEGETVDENGCSTSQVDIDGDGVFDDVDQCSDTPEGEAVDENGCSLNQLDTDPPVITDMSTTEVTSTSFTVNWSLNEGSKGYIQFGTSSGVYNASTGLEDNFLSDHVQTIGGTNPFPLNPNTTYYWQIYVEDEYGNSGFLAEQSTTTLIDQSKTFVPDDAFEQGLIDLGYDDVLDNYILTSSILNVTILELNDKGIRDLTGIEGFTQLEILKIENNYLSSIDVSKNLALKVLRVGSDFGRGVRNNLMTLDISKNLALEELNITWNSITTLDLKNNAELTKLGGAFNLLTSLDLSRNSRLINLTVPQNLLTNINLGNISNLIGIEAWSNQITDIDLSNNTQLKYLYLNNNQLSGIDLSQNITLKQVELNSNTILDIDVSQNKELESLQLQNNQLTSLDLSNNNAIKTLLCQYNNLTELNLQNGNNLNFTTVNVFEPFPTDPSMISNPDLYCVQVDNAEYSTNNWQGASYSVYSEDCGY